MNKSGHIIENVKLTGFKIYVVTLAIYALLAGLYFCQYQTNEIKDLTEAYLIISSVITSKRHSIIGVVLLILCIFDILSTLFNKGDKEALFIKLIRKFRITGLLISIIEICWLITMFVIRFDLMINIIVLGIISLFYLIVKKVYFNSKIISSLANWLLFLGFILAIDAIIVHINWFYFYLMYL